MHASSNPAQRFRYLPEEREDQIWGVFLRDAGRARIAPDAVYPPTGHPEGYHFQWNDGRILNEYQIVFISRGEGQFETRAAGRRAVRAGQAFIISPGDWHRYRPTPSTGWTETWLGFSGEYASHLMRNFFSPQQPIISLSRPRALARRMTAVVAGVSRLTKLGARSLLGLRVLEVIAHLQRSGRDAPEPSGKVRLEEARLAILTHAAERIDWLQMARRHGLGYATFRRRFREMTGRSPLDYQIQVRLNRAAELLHSSDLTAREIAERLGYAHVHFFSRQFKSRFGRSPQKFRER